MVPHSCVSDHHEPQKLAVRMQSTLLRHSTDVRYKASIMATLMQI